MVPCEIYRLFRRHIGGVRKGLEKSGHKCVGWCEWDRFARQSYEAIHDTEGEWTANDIRTVRSSEIPKADLWCFGFPCFLGGTLVLSQYGYAPIETLRVGDKVFTHKGRWRKITQVMHRMSKLWYVTGENILPTYTTENHPYYVKRNDEISFVKVKDIDKNCYSTFIFPPEWEKLFVPKGLQRRRTADGIELVYGRMGRPRELDSYGTVYNISVEEDESYIANGAIVHNCTDISVAGKQKGFFTEEGEQTRSGLFYEIIRLLRELPKEDRPKWLLAENVKNLLSIENGWGFTECLCALGEVGYDIEWQLFNTKYSYNVAGVCVPGIPQNRERVYLVGRLVGTASGRKVFPIDRADTKNSVELSQIGHQVDKNRDNPQHGRVYDTEGLAPALNCCEGGGLQPHIVDNNSQAYRVYDKDGLSPTLTCGHDGNQPHIIEENSVKQIGHIEGYKIDNPQAYRVYDSSGTSPTLVRASDGKVPWVLDDNDVKEVGYATSKDGNKIQSSRVYDKDGLSPTLTTGTGGNQQPMVIDDLYAGREPRVYKDSCPTLRSERSGLKVQAVLTPDRIEKRQNGRRMKEDGEPMFTLTTQDKHGVAIGGVYTNQGHDDNHKRGILEGIARTIKAESHDNGVAIEYETDTDKICKT